MNNADGRGRKVTRATPEPAMPSASPHPIDCAEMCLKMLTEVFVDLVGKNDAQQAAVQFMRRAAGVTFVMPAMPIAEKFARDFAILTRLRSDPSTAAVQHLAKIYSVPVRDIAKIFKTRNAGGGIMAERQRRSTTPGLVSDPFPD